MLFIDLQGDFWEQAREGNPDGIVNEQVGYSSRQLELITLDSSGRSHQELPPPRCEKAGQFTHQLFHLLLGKGLLPGVLTPRPFWPLPHESGKIQGQRKP